jgi:hypothetical protein
MNNEFKTIPQKIKAHQIYRNSDDQIVPSVTTILGILNKPALVKWANNLGLQGIDSSRYTDEMASIGTLAHAMVVAHLKNEKLDLREYSPDQISKAENCVLKYLEWEKDKKVEPLLIERPLVSKMLQFGGQVDLYCKLNGVPTLIDFKTSKAVYSEMIHQLAAYRYLLIENHYPVEQVFILRIGRDETEGFEVKLAGNLDTHFELFTRCLEIYNLKKLLKE